MYLQWNEELPLETSNISINRSVIAKLPKPAYMVSWEATGTSTHVRNVFWRGGMACTQIQNIDMSSLEKSFRCIRIFLKNRLRGYKSLHFSGPLRLMWKDKRHFVPSTEVAVKEWPYFLALRMSLQAYSSPNSFQIVCSASLTLG